MEGRRALAKKCYFIFMNKAGYRVSGAGEGDLHCSSSKQDCLPPCCVGRRLGPPPSAGWSRPGLPAPQASPGRAHPQGSQGRPAGEQRSGLTSVCVCVWIRSAEFCPLRGRLFCKLFSQTDVFETYQVEITASAYFLSKTSFSKRFALNGA